MAAGALAAVAPVAAVAAGGRGCGLQLLHPAFQQQARPGAGAACAHPAAGTGQQQAAADQEVGHDQHRERAADQERRGAGHRHLRGRRAQGGWNISVAWQHGDGEKTDAGQPERAHVDRRQLANAGPVAGEQDTHFPAPVGARQHVHAVHRQPLAGCDGAGRAERRGAAHHDARQHPVADAELRRLEPHLLPPLQFGKLIRRGRVRRRAGGTVHLGNGRRHRAPRRGAQDQPRREPAERGPFAPTVTASAPAVPAPSTRHPAPPPAVAQRGAHGRQHVVPRRLRPRRRKNAARAAPGSSPVAISSKSTRWRRQPARMSRKWSSQ